MIMASLEIFDLTGRTALVTGSTRGLGSVLAEGLADCGARVAVHGRDAQAAESAAEALRQKGLDALSTGFDLTDPAAVQAGCEELLSRCGQVDILVNNAGIQRRGPLEQLEEDDWQAVIETNLSAAWRVARHLAPEMIRRRGGKIINICSLMSELARPTVGPYAAAKGGLKMLTRAMACEWARHDIQCNGIAPGYFATEMTAPLRADAAFDSWLRGRTPAGRWGEPEELVGAAVFLASRASSFVNGEVIYVDGGVRATI
jgi:gluconate 5-dehydrogenase